MSIALRRASEASQLQSTLCDSVTQKTPCLGAAGKSRGTGNGNLFVARRCEASGEAGMHRSEAEGRFGEAEPEGRASVCAEPILRSVGVQDKMERASWECGAVNYPDAPFTHFLARFDWRAKRNTPSLISPTDARSGSSVFRSIQRRAVLPTSRRSRCADLRGKF